MDNYENNNKIQNSENEQPESAVQASTGKMVIKEIWEWVYTIVIAIAIAFLIKAFVFDVVKVDGSSMFPTLENNDRLIVTKLGYEPNAGDIIILDSRYKEREEYFDKLALTQGKDELSKIDKLMKTTFSMPEDLKKRFYVKRIIALPGQTIDIRDGKVFVDGNQLDEEYYHGVTTGIDPRQEFPQTVGENMVFVMGDNRPNSKDSRSTELGQVPYEAILGKSQLRIWPLNKIGTTK
ncbi:MAG: signal peptidase I [bacterium]|nr:signal peptidase I [bacterium]